MVYTPKAIAYYFLNKAEAEGRSLTPLQVIKLVFIAHGWHLGLTGKDLVTEVPQAWKYGPVFPSLYKEFRRFGDEPIAKLRKGSADQPFAQKASEPPTPAAEKNVCQLLDRVWSIYGNLSGSQLSTLTHQQDSPWEITWNELEAKDTKEVQIPGFLIKEYYQNLLSSNAHPGVN